MAQVLSRSPRDGALLASMADIAGLAGVRRPVVTTWRRRHADFPAPVGDDTPPLFDAREVCEWLIATGRAERGRLEPDLHLHALASFDSALPPRALVTAVTALICLRHLDDEPLADGGRVDLDDLRDRAAAVDPADDLLLSEVTALPYDLGWLARTVDDLIEAAWGCRGAFERIMTARDRLGARELCSSTVDAGLARLVAGLSGVRERARHGGSVVVADPAAGPGDLLAAVARLAVEDCAPVVVAAEPEAYLARLVRRRLTVHGVPTIDQDVRVGAELGEDAGDPDAVVTQLPYAPAESRSAADALARIDEIGLRLPPGRTAVVLGPADVLTGALRPYSPDERARAELLTGGMVEAVIRLPGGLVPFRPGYETAVWVLSSAYASPLRGRVLLGDVSDRPLTADVVDALVADVVTWRRDGYPPGAHTRTFCVQADVGDLVDEPGALTARRLPSVRERATEVPAAVARVAELESALARLADPAATPREPVRTGVARAAARRPGGTRVGGLVRAGRLTLVKGARLAPEHVTADGHHPVLGAPEVTGGVDGEVSGGVTGGLSGGRRAGGRYVDRGVLAERYPRAVLTEPGDIVVTTAPTPGVLIDHEGYCVVEFPARALRIPDSERGQLTPRVLAALLTAGGGVRRAAGAVRAPRRLEDWEVPLLASGTVRRLDRLLAELDERRRLAQDEIDALDELRRIATAGLADGTLTLQP